MDTTTLVGCGVPLLFIILLGGLAYGGIRREKAKKEAELAERKRMVVHRNSAEKQEAEHLNKKYPPFKSIPANVLVLRSIHDLSDIPYDHRDLRMIFTIAELQFFTADEIMAVVKGKSSLVDIRKKYYKNL